VQTNLTAVNFLDVNLNLTSGLYKPYRKPNDKPVYINRLSNHPPSIIKNIPKAIQKRISTLSSNKETFDHAAPDYISALNNAGYTEDVSYSDAENRAQPGKRRNRTRKIVWYNPPFSRSVKTNIGGKFFKLVDRHFPRGSKLSKIFNRNNVKISYSCMRNVNQIIKTHNASAMSKGTQASGSKLCNCRQKNECPLRGKCLVEDVVYIAKVHADNKVVNYIGLASGRFKLRYYNHTKSFRHERFEKETELSKYVWNLKRKQLEYSITWDILKYSNTKKRDSGQCNLCIEEKYQIFLCAKSSDSAIINTRTELISKCRHGNLKPTRVTRKKKKKKSNRSK